MSQTYRVIAKGIRVQRPGRPHLEVKRPRNPDTGQFLDSDAAPTLITFADDDDVDIATLLRQGSIVAWPPSEPAAHARTRTRKSREDAG